MKVAVESPAEFQGAVLKTIMQRRGIVVGTTEEEGFCAVEAEVPLAEMFGYATDLRSATQGKAEFTMEFAQYSPAPAELTEKLIEKYKARHQGRGLSPRMYRKFLNERSPLRLLEKGLHGGLGKGNLGLLLAGRGVGKTACLVGIALDDLLRGGHVLHVALDQTRRPTCAPSTTRCSTTSPRPPTSRTPRACAARCDRRRSIRAYPAPGFSAAKLREAVKFESEAGARPELVIVEGFDLAAAPRDELLDLRALAGELQARDLALGLGAGRARPRAPGGDPADRGPAERDPRPRARRTRRCALRALKDHDSPDLSALHVALDPKTLLLKRS